MGTPIERNWCVRPGVTHRRFRPGCRRRTRAASASPPRRRHRRSHTGRRPGRTGAAQRRPGGSRRLVASQVASRAPRLAVGSCNGLVRVLSGEECSAHRGAQTAASQARRHHGPVPVVAASDHRGCVEGTGGRPQQQGAQQHGYCTGPQYHGCRSWSLSLGSPTTARCCRTVMTAIAVRTAAHTCIQGETVNWVGHSGSIRYNRSRSPSTRVPRGIQITASLHIHKCTACTCINGTRLHCHPGLRSSASQRQDGARHQCLEAVILQRTCARR